MWDAGSWGGLALPHHAGVAGLLALSASQPLAGREPINKAFQPVTSMLNPLKAVLLWAH